MSTMTKAELFELAKLLNDISESMQYGKSTFQSIAEYLDEVGIEETISEDNRIDYWISRLSEHCNTLKEHLKGLHYNN